MVLRLTWDLERAAVATQEAIEKAQAILLLGVTARDDLTVAADSVAALADGWSLVVCSWDGGGDTGSGHNGGDDLGDLHICGWLFEAERLE